MYIYIHKQTHTFALHSLAFLKIRCTEFAYLNIWQPSTDNTRSCNPWLSFNTDVFSSFCSCIELANLYELLGGSITINNQLIPISQKCVLKCFLVYPTLHIL